MTSIPQLTIMQLAQYNYKCITSITNLFNNFNN